jgi:hypothetical protein
MAIARTSRFLRPSSIDDRIAASVSGARTVIGADISARKRILRRRATVHPIKLTNGPAHDDEAMVCGTHFLPGAPKTPATGGAWSAGEIGQS